MSAISQGLSGPGKTSRLPLAALFLLAGSCSSSTLTSEFVPNVAITTSGLAWVEVTAKTDVLGGRPGNLIRWERRTNKRAPVASCDGFVDGLAAVGDTVYMSCAPPDLRSPSTVFVSDGYAKSAVVLMTMNPLWNPPPEPQHDVGPVVCSASTRFLLIANAESSTWRVALDRDNAADFLGGGGGYRCDGLVMSQDAVFWFGNSIVRVDPSVTTSVDEYADTPGTPYGPHSASNGYLFWASSGLSIWAHSVGQTTATKLAVDPHVDDDYTSSSVSYIAGDATHVYWSIGFAAAIMGHDPSRFGFIIRRVPISGGVVETVVDDPSGDYRHLLSWLGVDDSNVYWVDDGGLKYHAK
jgi:hypothetical protein